MSAEHDLQDFARRAVACANEAKRASDDETRQRYQGMRSVLLMDAQGLVARNLGALKAKALMVWDEDWVQNPTSADAGLVRSLLRDLLHEP